MLRAAHLGAGTGKAEELGVARHDEAAGAGSEEVEEGGELGGVAEAADVYAVVEALVVR